MGGKGGNTKSENIYSGGGGSGGIIVKGYSPTSESANTEDYYGNGGENGVGFGAGGGGGGNWNGLRSQQGGAGKKGFVYIYEDDNLITKSGEYNTSNDGVYHIIMMGGGGAGSSFSERNWGGCSGNIKIFKRNIKSSDILDIKIGNGGKEGSTVFGSCNGDSTKILINELDKYEANGGLSGDVINNRVVQRNLINDNNNSALGGKSTENGGVVDKVIIDVINKID